MLAVAEHERSVLNRMRDSKMHSAQTATCKKYVRNLAQVKDVALFVADQQGQHAEVSSSILERHEAAGGQSGLEQMHDGFLQLSLGIRGQAGSRGQSGDAAGASARPTCKVTIHAAKSREGHHALPPLPTSKEGVSQLLQDKGVALESYKTEAIRAMYKLATGNSALSGMPKPALVAGIINALLPGEDYCRAMRWAATGQGTADS